MPGISLRVYSFATCQSTLKHIANAFMSTILSSVLFCLVYDRLPCHLQLMTDTQRTRLHQLWGESHRVQRRRCPQPDRHNHVLRRIAPDQLRICGEKPRICVFVGNGFFICVPGQQCGRVNVRRRRTVLRPRRATHKRQPLWHRKRRDAVHNSRKCIRRTHQGARVVLQLVPKQVLCPKQVSRNTHSH